MITSDRSASRFDPIRELRRQLQAPTRDMLFNNPSVLLIAAAVDAFRADPLAQGQLALDAGDFGDRIGAYGAVPAVTAPPRL
jgi:hypothetical protein